MSNTVDQQQHDDNPFFSKISNQEQANRARALVTPVVHHMCATLIQKLARGMVTRTAFANLRIEYYVSSKYIQAAIRGFLVRRRVAKMYWENAASIIIQRISRGMLARRLVRVRRHKLLVLKSTIAIQKTVRGHFGRIRIGKVRHLFSARSDIVSASDVLQISDFKELAEACYKMVAIPSTLISSEPDKAKRKPLTPLVLGLVRMLMLFTSDSDAQVDVSNVRWKEAANFLRCSVRLVRRMKKIALAAEGRHLRVSVLGNALLDAYLADQEFEEETFRRLESGWKGASTIFKWITSFSVITRLQDVLPAYNLGFDGPFLIANAIDKREAAQDQIEENENVMRDEDVERRFVPAHLVQVAGFPHHRPRPVVLVFAYDVPLDSKRVIMDKLLSALPGLFVVMNRSRSGPEGQQIRREASFKHDTTSSFRSLQDTPWTTSRHNNKRNKTNFDWDGLDIAEIRNTVNIGYNVILESDIGLSDPPQRSFLGAFSALKAAIQPSPLCILVNGSLKNRGANVSEPEQEAETDSDMRINRGSPTKSGRRMTDVKIKRAFESAAEYLFELSQPQVISQMTQIRAIESPVIQFIIVMEAVIILLTPTKRYDGPKASTSYVSWKLGRRLLGRPSFFLTKLQDVKQQDIARENLLALERYLKHSDWPTRTQAHSLGPHGELLFALASWVEAIVKCAHLAMDCQGLAQEISRTTPVRGLFGNVVTFLNVDCEPISKNQDSGEASCVLKLMDAVLADVRVYRTCHDLDGRKCIVDVYHDCLRIFFSAYDPTSSRRWQTVIAESDVDNLLAPNSIERGDMKLPPKTKTEMYDRLVQLCLLQARQKISSLVGTENTTACDSQQLVVRPRAIRLYRRAIQLSGYLATVTISELSRGRVQVDAFVHNSSNGKDMRAIFSLESISKRMSSQQAHACFVAPKEISQLVLDRLHLFRIAQSLTSREKSRHHQQLSHTKEQLEQQRPSLIDEQMEMKLGIRTRETVTGRLLMRKAVRSPLLNAVWLCSVFEIHATSDFRVEFYQPQTSDRFSMRLSQLDCEDFVLKSKYSNKTALQLMMKYFRFQRDSEPENEDNGEGGEADASVIGCKARRILARFPWAIPFKRNPHHTITKREVVRVYIQVERQQSGSSSVSPASSSSAVSQGQLRSFGLQYRITLPDTCEEQSLVLSDSEIESYFAGKISWLNASGAAARQRLSRELVKCFVWQPAARDSPPNSASTNNTDLVSRVVAQLPSGPVEAFTSTRNTDKKKKQPPPRPPSRIKRSPFSARGSLSETPVLSSCVQLLDPSTFDTEAATASTTNQPPVKRCYTYNSEEMVHKGSYRANGVLVIVQVSMKAVIVDTLVPQIPVDRIKQEDSFVLTFNFYHPSSSSGVIVLIKGRKDLREVVGPDQAHLIRASAIHELMQHIVERRTEALLKPVVKVVHSNSFKGQQPPVATVTSSTGPPMQLEINFQRDRLFAKQKVTPINQSFAKDNVVNTTKLIDKAPERGLKVLTRTRVVSDFGRVILTVFDVGFTQNCGLKGDDENEQNEGDLSSAVFRVDAYVYDTSSRLSLLVQGTEILHVVGDDLDLLSNNSSGQQENEQRRRQLAQLIIDHVGIEARQDGVTSDRLFIAEYFTPAQEENLQANITSLPSKEKQKKKKLLLFKTTRALGHDQILISVYMLDDCAIAIRCYEPRSSQSSEVVVQRETLSLMLGLEESKLTESVLASPQIPLITLMTHICSFVRIERRVTTSPSWNTEVSQASEAKLIASLIYDEQRAHDCRSRFATHSGQGSSPVTTWSGMAVGSSRPSYFAVRVLVLKSPTPFAIEGCEVLCSAYSPSTGMVATAKFTSVDLTRLSGDSEISSAEDLVVRVRERLQLELLEDEKPSEGNDQLGVKVSIILGRDEWKTL